MDNTFKNGCPGHGLCAKGCAQSDKPLTVYDYLADIPGENESTDLVEVQFKNTRKGYYHNSNHIPLEKGDIVAVEATPGHDIGVVTLTGRLVELQIKKANLKSEDDIKRIYRKARPTDMEKYDEARSKEHDTMIRARQIAQNLGLEMKIGDVEYQGDGGKAIFYYIADGRVDFRQLIKVLAETFRVRIEMKQIGARQEAGRIGGIGPCGRILCCASWMKNFVSVSTGAARLQDLSPNPQKLAGQCAKLKCCLNFETDTYIEASRKLPSKEIVLYTQDAEYYYFKADILKNEITYSTDKHLAANLVTLPASRIFEIIGMNRRGEKPAQLMQSETTEHPTDLVQQESLTRFDRDRKKKNKNNRKKGNNSNATVNADTAANVNVTEQDSDNKTAQAGKQSSPKIEVKDNDRRKNNGKERRKNEARNKNNAKEEDSTRKSGTEDNKKRDSNNDNTKPQNESERMRNEGKKRRDRNNRSRDKERNANQDNNNPEDEASKKPEQNK